MKTLKIIIVAFGLVPQVAYGQETDSRFMQGFTENFSTSEPQYFNMDGSKIRYYSGVHSLIEENTDVMLMSIQPTDPWGAGRGPQITSPQMTHFGRYSARIRVADVKEAQPNIGVVTGYFTYRFTKGYGLSEIDFEWLMADPTIIYVGTWTSAPDDGRKLQRVGRTINLAKGEILYTNYRSYHDGKDFQSINHYFDESDDAANTPRTIPAIADYDASKRFYVYGFDWYPNRLTWWMEHPETGEKIILWDYQGTTPHFSGIPQSPTTHMLNFWHTNNWPVDTNPNSIEAPKYPYTMDVDWMKYEPFDDLNATWRAENKF